MNPKIFFLSIFILLVFFCHGQEGSKKNKMVVYGGIGAGLDYGGIGF
jgi:hypothetical protein